MNVCMYVCMYVFIYLSIYLFTFIYLFIYSCMDVYMDACMDACMDVWMYDKLTHCKVETAGAATPYHFLQFFPVGWWKSSAMHFDFEQMANDTDIFKV